MDERQILLDAKDLITQKRYQEARRLLQPIAAHPTARKWLETLDKIAPPPPPALEEDDPFALPDLDPFGSPAANPYADLTHEEKFEQVKVLLKAKDYDEARQILMTLPDDPSAQQLLAKINQMRPSKPPTFASDALSSPFGMSPRTESNPFATPTQTPFGISGTPTQSPFGTPVENQGGYTFPPPIQKDLTGIPPYSKPWNPQNFTVVILMFSWGALILYSLNWRRFGRPKWAWPSFLIGVLLLAVPLGGLGIAGAAGIEVKAELAAIPIMLAFGGFYLYLMGQYWYQSKEYKRYQIYGDVGGPNKYKYDVYWIGGGVVFLVVGMLVAVLLASQWATRPKELDTAYLTIEQPTGWTTTPGYEANNCSSYPQGCFLILRDLTTDAKNISFVYFPLEGLSYETRVSGLWQQYQQWYPNLQYGPRSELMIDGQSVTFQEFLSPPIYSPDGAAVGNNYLARGYVPTTDGVIEITFWSSSEEEFRRYYTDFTDVFATIDLK